MRKPPSDFTRIMRETRVWEERYDTLLSGTPESKIVGHNVTVYDRNKLTRSIELKAIVDRHGKVQWFDESGNKLPKSVGWVIRDFALKVKQ